MANVGSGASGKTLIGAGNGASPTYASIGTNSGLTSHGVVISQGNGAFQATATGTAGQILTSNGAASDPTWQPATSGAISWNAITASQTLAVRTGYICISPGGALSLALPATAAVGDIIEITLDGATSFTITQGAGQSIRMGNVSTTSGVGGSLASTQQGDSIRLVCSVTNLKFNVLSSMGNPTIV